MREDILTAVLALVGITAMVSAMKIAGVLDWSWWWVLTPPVLGVAGIVWMVRGK